MQREEITTTDRYRVFACSVGKGEHNGPFTQAVAIPLKFGTAVPAYANVLGEMQIKRAALALAKYLHLHGMVYDAKDIRKAARTCQVGV